MSEVIKDNFHGRVAYIGFHGVAISEALGSIPGRVNEESYLVKPASRDSPIENITLFVIDLFSIFFKFINVFSQFYRFE